MGQVAVLLFKSGWNLISIPSNIHTSHLFNW
jgi:hypothetical protein